MQTDCIFESDSVRFINLRLHKLEDPPDPRNENGAPLATGRRISTKTYKSGNNLDEDAAQGQEARVREWVARWRQTRRSDGDAVVACHPFGCEAAQ
jgi:hypothetical protein